MYGKLTLLLGHKEVHMKSSAETPEGVVHALQHGLQQDACMLLAVRG